jgi:hypothetical protein
MEGSVTMQEDTLPRLTISYQKNVIWFGQLSFAKAHKARASSYLLETGIVSRPPPRQLVKTIRQSLQCIPDLSGRSTFRHRSIFVRPLTQLLSGQV